MKYLEALVASQLYEEFVDPSVASQKSISAVGMICCEEGRLKEKPIMLQSSVQHSGGQRVRLDLQKLDQFSIFPGQVVGVEGHNPSGHYLIATKIVEYVPLPVPDGDETKKQTMDLDKTMEAEIEVQCVVPEEKVCKVEDCDSYCLSPWSLDFNLIDCAGFKELLYCRRAGSVN